MKLNLTKKLGLALGITMISGIGVHAATWHNFSATMPAYMGYVSSNTYTKEDDDKYMSFKGSSVPISINMVLMNSDGSARSDRLTYGAYKTDPLWAQEKSSVRKGFYYHLRLNTSTGQTSQHNVYGNWSPDYIR